MGDRGPFVEVHDALTGAPDGSAAAELLAPFTAAAREEVERLRGLGAPSAASRPRSEIGPELESLDRLTRVLDRLLLGFQPGSERDVGPVPALSVEELTSWAEEIGLRVPERAFYHPFFHEALEVRPGATPDADPRFVEHLWPCLMLERLMVVRGGVVISAGKNVLDPQLATSTPLHFTHLRAYRETRPPPSFRRDYLTPGAYVYNADGEFLIEPSIPASGPMHEAGWSIPERIELLRNRCMVVTDKQVGTADPHGDRFVEVR